jgi:uncharacterized membrane protein YccC
MPTLEQRVSELESQMQRLLQSKLRTEAPAAEPWRRRHSGAFENNRLYDEAMRHAVEYRRVQPTPADCPEEFTD